MNAVALVAAFSLSLAARHSFAQEGDQPAAAAPIEAPDTSPSPTDAGAPESALPPPDVVGDAVETAARLAQASEGQMGALVDIPAFLMALQFSQFMRTYDIKVNYLRWPVYAAAAVFGASSLIGLASPESALLGPAEPAELGEGNTRFDYVSYIIQTKRSGALTGSVKRRQKGFGLGSHLELQFPFTDDIPYLLYVFKMDFQQVDLAHNDYAYLTNYFYKLEPVMVSFDAAYLLYQLTNIAWFKRSALEARVGVSTFGDWLRVSTPGSPAIDETLSRSQVLMRGHGYEYGARADFDLVLLHVQGVLEGGYYGKLTYPGISADNFLYVKTVSFDQLRGQDSYGWRRYKVLVDLPLPFLFGETWSENSRLSGGYEIFKLEGSDNQGLDNQGFSITASFES